MHLRPLSSEPIGLARPKDPVVIHAPPHESLRLTHETALTKTCSDAAGNPGPPPPTFLFLHLAPCPFFHCCWFVYFNLPYLTLPYLKSGISSPSVGAL